MRIFTFSFIATVMGLVLAAMTANAQSTATPKPNPATAKPAEAAAKAPPQPWNVSCSAVGGQAGLNCSMVQTVFAKNSRLRIISVSISRAAAASGLQLQLSLPHGVALQSGAEIWVDKGAPKKLPIRNADANGSYAFAEIDSELLGSLRKGSLLNTAFQTLDGKRVVLQISLNGFTSAFAKL